MPAALYSRHSENINREAPEGNMSALKRQLHHASSAKYSVVVALTENMCKK